MALQKLFRDVTSGSNPGCGDLDGFTATIGWDPVTGLGVPKVQGHGDGDDGGGCLGGGGGDCVC